MFMQRLTDHVLRIVCLREAKGEGIYILVHVWSAECCGFESHPRQLIFLVEK